MVIIYRFILTLMVLLYLNTGIAQKAPLPSPSKAVPPPAVLPPQPVASTEPPSPKLWNLQDADIISVINEISQETGKNFVIDPRVQGKITLISSKPIKSEDAYQVFLSILGLLGYSAIPSDNVIKIVPNIESGELATSIATNKSPGKGDEVVVRVISLEHVSANQLIPVLRPLLPQWSNIAAYTPGNVLILVGRAANLERLAEIVRNVDKASDNSVDVIPLRRATASQVAGVLNNLQNSARSAGETPTIFVAADERSNSILLSGNKSARLRTRILISQLDSPTIGTQENTEVVYLRYLQAKTFAPVLGKVAQNLLGKGDTSKDSTSAASAAQPSSYPRSLADEASSNQAKPRTAATPENLTNIQAEPSTNALIILAPPSLMRALNSIIAKLDVRPAQVLVEAVIVELSQSDLKNFGIQWGSVSSTSTTNTASGTDTTQGGGSAPFDFPPAGAGTLGIIPHQHIQAVLNALENTIGADILSTPTVVVLDNHKANLQVGQDIPEQTGSYTMTGSTPQNPFNTIGRKSVSLTLVVTPQINLGNAVRLTIGLTNDSLQNPQSPGLNPIINTSKITNSVIVESGDILVLGGLIRNNVTENIVKVPILGDIPLIGKIFQNKSRSLEKRNLMVFIKPVILHTDEDASSITNTKYDLIRKKQQLWPEDLSTTGVQKRENILPLWKSTAELPAPFETL